VKLIDTIDGMHGGMQLSFAFEVRPRRYAHFSDEMVTACHRRHHCTYHGTQMIDQFVTVRLSVGELLAWISRLVVQSCEVCRAVGLTDAR